MRQHPSSGPSVSPVGRIPKPILSGLSCTEKFCGPGRGAGVPEVTGAPGSGTGLRMWVLRSGDSGSKKKRGQELQGRGESRESETPDVSGP